MDKFLTTSIFLQHKGQGGFMIRVFDLFKIGVGPSSSHTVGPMVAANQFLQQIQAKNFLDDITHIFIDLYGSLAATGKGHATDTAILLGLLGHEPKTIDTLRKEEYLAPVMREQVLLLAGQKAIHFDYEQDLHWHDDTVMPYHPNALTITAKLANGEQYQQTYYSIGGGFVLNADDISHANDTVIEDNANQDPYPFSTAETLQQLCETHHMSISELVMANELHYRNRGEIESYLDDIWAVMEQCVRNGYQDEGILPGGLQIKRRAKALHDKLQQEKQQNHNQNDSLVAMDWVDLYAIAATEENANGGKVVTAPTNGAAGIIPAVLHYYRDFIASFSRQGVHDFLLTATAIGSLIKQNASISGAEVGCQGEVGSACAMAAAGLTQVLGGDVSQCLNAAEIGIEHNLGLTCDPIDGLVQVPCIERNAMGAIKSINAARLALRGNGQHFVSLDKAILTMKQTGADMSDKYKETAKGGLAIHAKSLAKNIIPTATVGVTVNYSAC